MKISLRLQDDDDHNNPLIRAKIPITIINQPFTSSIATLPSATSTSTSFSLSSNFSAGPSIKLSYSHSSSLCSPFSLSIKSGLGLFGSPNHSPLIFTAHFSLSSSNPSFSLHFKPQLGNFTLRKTTLSDPPPHPKTLSGSLPNPDLGTGSGSDGDFVNGFVSAAASSSAWQEVKLRPFGGEDVAAVEERQMMGFKNGVLSGIAVMARTVLPLTKRVIVNMRWGVNIPAKMGSKLPYLTVNKIGIERYEEVKEEEVVVEKLRSGVGDLKMLKGICFWMRRDLEVLEKENREMKERLEDMKGGVFGKNFCSESGVSRKRVSPPLGESSGEFERWRIKKGGGRGEENVRAAESHMPAAKSVREENGRMESKKPTGHGSQASDLESELERAIKAAMA